MVPILELNYIPPRRRVSDFASSELRKHRFNKAIKSAKELRKKKIKDIFDCAKLVEKEVEAFNKWRGRAKIKLLKAAAGEKSAADYETALALYIYTCATPKCIREKLKSESERRPFFTNSKIMPDEILKTREGQCVAFTILYCAMAEELGLNAKPFSVSQKSMREVFNIHTGDGHVVPAFIISKDKCILFDSANFMPNARLEGNLKEKEHLLAEVLLYESIALYNNDEPAEALECVGKALKIEEENSQVWYNKGLYLDSLGRSFNEILQCYNKALALDKDNPRIWSNKGHAFCDIMGKDEEAVECYNTALAIDRKAAYAWFNKGIALKRMGLREKAKTCFEKAKKYYFEQKNFEKAKEAEEELKKLGK